MIKLTKDREYHALYTEKSEWLLGRYMLAKIWLCESEGVIMKLTIMITG